MLRIHFMQQWFSLSDPAMEEAFFDTPLYREFAQLDEFARLPDECTILRFGHRLEKHKLAEQILLTVNELLTQRGLLLKVGTAVDATLIAAPISTKNKVHARDPEMHQAKKGNQWHFGLKAHIGVDKDSGLVHTLTTTAANVSDISQTPALLHGQESAIWADAGYVGVEKREDMQLALSANEQPVQWHVDKRRKTITKMANGWQKSMAQVYEKLKAQVRAYVEHPFHVVKNIFKYKKTRYKGLTKNDTQLNMLFALSNLYMVRGKLRP
jgi:IS5 family transposase